MQLISSQPLTEDEFKKLHDILSLNCQSEKPMSLTQVHGFLTAIVSAPNMIMPSQWQPMLFGGNPEFQSKEEFIVSFELTGRWHNSINDAIKNNDTFEPLLFKDNTIVPLQDASIELVGEWCNGYMQGADLDEFWSTDDAAIESLYPFAILSGQVEIVDKSENGIEEANNQKIKMLEKLPIYIKKIYEEWLSLRKLSMINKRYGTPAINFNDDINLPYEREGIKTGRNDPCPCGSGKKHKKCCLSSIPSIH